MPAGIKGMTNSYNSNSRPQMRAIELSIPFIQRAIEVLDLSSLPSTQPVIIADFGSSHGLNSMYAMKVIIENLKTSKNKQRSVLVIHHDLPTNNWTILFDLLNKDNSYFGLANGRSFYEQCLPSNSLSIGYSLRHCNGCHVIHVIYRIIVSLFCSNDEYDIFKQQAHLDYLRFLEYRSNELIPGGVLILCFPCLNDKGLFGFEILFQLLYKCATLLPITQQELLDYTYPLYYRTYEEYINYDLFKKFSLKLIKSELCDTRTDTFTRFQQGELTLDEFVKDHTRFLRSWTEPSLRETLERNNHCLDEEVETLLDQFWNLYEREVKELSNQFDLCCVYAYLILKKDLI